MGPVQIGSIVALVLSFVKDLIKEEGKKNRWNRTIIIAVPVLLLNAYVVIANYHTEIEHRKVQKTEEEARQAETRADIRSLTESATQAFDKLQRTLASLPIDSAEALKSQADAIKYQLIDLKESVVAGHVDPSSVPRIQASVENIQESVNKLAVKSTA